MTILAGGIFLFPSCSKQEDGEVSIKMHKMNINAAQEKLVGNVVETIIPQTTTPGAKALNVHLFVLKMMDDCYSKKDQENFLLGMNKLDENAKKRYSCSFSECKPRECEAILMTIEENPKIQPQLAAFYQVTKQLTVEGYSISKYVMTTKLPYELVPSRYSGYFPVKNLKTAVKNG
ncbi:MAG: gluconate 2-dehydrogenase subunit 3 family protein [Janthinobacterium lividum]